jgi:hypothetical protein
VLDLAFREDDCRVRSAHAAENFAILRHIALNLLRRETATKIGIKAKRLKCGWDETYLRHALAGYYAIALRVDPRHAPASYNLAHGPLGVGDSCRETAGQRHGQGGPRDEHQ